MPLCKMGDVNSKPLQRLKGFSLIEILISLVIISLTAVNITGLQNKIAQQQRDNIVHAAVLLVATEKIEEALSLETVSQLNAMNNASETISHNTIGDISIHWQVTDVENDVFDSEELKQISLRVSWLGKTAQTQSFTYTSQVNFGTLLSTTSTQEQISEIEDISSIITSAINSNEIIFFEENTSYQAGSFVIFDSYLYQATQAYQPGDDWPHYELGTVDLGDGWQSFGPIDNPELANIENLATIF